MNNNNYNNKQCYHNHFENMPIGMAYVPWQNWNNIYDIENGFRAGTIFCDLNKPYYGGTCK